MSINRTEEPTMKITQEQLEQAARAAAISEFDGPKWRGYVRATQAAFQAVGIEIEEPVKVKSTVAHVMALDAAVERGDILEADRSEIISNATRYRNMTGGRMSDAVRSEIAAFVRLGRTAYVDAAAAERKANR